MAGVCWLVVRYLPGSSYTQHAASQAASQPASGVTLQLTKPHSSWLRAIICCFVLKWGPETCDRGPKHGLFHKIQTAVARSETKLSRVLDDVSSNLCLNPPPPPPAHTHTPHSDEVETYGSCNSIPKLSQFSGCAGRFAVFVATSVRAPTHVAD